MDNEKLTINIPGLNVESGLGLCDGDVPIYLNSLRLCVSNLPASLEKMRIVSAETLRDYSVLVHGAKGISAYIGAEDARKMAKDLEAKAKSGDLAGVLANNDAFIKHMGDLIVGIRNWLEKNNTLGV